MVSYSWGSGKKPSVLNSKAALEERKKSAIENLEQRIKIMQESKACVSKASKGEDLKKCHIKTQQDMKKLRESFGKKRAEFLKKMGIKPKRKPVKPESPKANPTKDTKNKN
jgi:hypothetical protein